MKSQYPNNPEVAYAVVMAGNVRIAGVVVFTVAVRVFPPRVGRDMTYIDALYDMPTVKFVRVPAAVAVCVLVDCSRITLVPL